MTNTLRFSKSILSKMIKYHIICKVLFSVEYLISCFKGANIPRDKDIAMKIPYMIDNTLLCITR